MARKSLDPSCYTVGWICALPVEVAAATRMLDEAHDEPPQDENDSNIYTLGRICGHNVVIAGLPAGQMGTTSAAAVAIQMRVRFSSLRFGLMVGIGGGVPSSAADIRLGDVVISKPSGSHGGVVQYDFGKATPDGFLTTGSTLNAPPTVLLNALTKLQASHLGGNVPFGILPPESKDPYFTAFGLEDVLFHPNYNHVGGPTCAGCDQKHTVGRLPRPHQGPVYHYGTIGSGNQVIRDAITRDRLSSELGGILCFEMEAAGLMNSFPCLVIRGICDYADSHKNKTWQPYAAITAATCAREVLSLIPTTEVTAFPEVDNKMRERVYQVLRETIKDLSLYGASYIFEWAGGRSRTETEQISCSWIFDNADYHRWKNASQSSAVLASGPPGSNLGGAVSRMVWQQRRECSSECLVMCSQFSGDSNAPSVVRDLVHNFLFHIIRQFAATNGVSFAQNFLYKLLDRAGRQEREFWRRIAFDPQEKPLRFLMRMEQQVKDEDRLAVLEEVLMEDQNPELWLTIIGMDKIWGERQTPLRLIRGFIERLFRRKSRVKVFLGTGTDAEINDIFSGIERIEYDKERRECLETLRFENIRFKKVQEGHKGSFEWLWRHPKYREWSTSRASRILLVKGKPGSGKSTLTKYFNDNIRAKEPRMKSAMIAKFFYSDREGELQKSHYHMLRSVLHDLILQDDGFFYNQIQDPYRKMIRQNGASTDAGAKWDYETLKLLLLSASSYSWSKKRIYILIDAVDESDKEDRASVLRLLFRLCSEMQHNILKIFVASRPAGEIESDIDKFHSLIYLQDETRNDILQYAKSFVEKLDFGESCDDAIRYIVDNADGVFIWTALVGTQLRKYHYEGRPEGDIFLFLKSLPKGLEDMYQNMFDKMTEDGETSRDAIKMFKLVLFAARPLMPEELLHALRIPDGDVLWESDWSHDYFKSQIPKERYITYCSGNFLEIKGTNETRSVQVVHQTVREFFLRTNGYVASNEFKISRLEAHDTMSITCIGYLRLLDNLHLVEKFEPVKNWSPVHFERYATFLDEWKFAPYALLYLTYHSIIDNTTRPSFDLFQSLKKSIRAEPSKYLLSAWLAGSASPKKPTGTILSPKAERFRISLLYTTVLGNYPTALRIMLSVAEGRSNTVDKHGRSLLSRAAGIGHVAIVKTLFLDTNIRPDLRDKDGRTPLSWAAQKVQAAVVSLLLKREDVDPDSVDNIGRSPLSRAAEEGNTETVGLLVVHPRVNPFREDKTGRSSLSWAAAGGHLGTVKVLLEHVKTGADTYDVKGFTPPLWAASQGHLHVVKLLLSLENVRPNFRDKEEGCNALHWAARSGHDDIIKLLLRTPGVDPFEYDNYRRTPLLLAAANGHKSVVRRLMAQAPSTAQTTDFCGRSPLSWAAGRGHEGVVKVLLACDSVDADEGDCYGRTPLSWAAEGGHERVVSFLLTQDSVRLDTRDNLESRTPVMWAEEGGHRSVIDLLKRYRKLAS